MCGVCCVLCVCVYVLSVVCVCVLSGVCVCVCVCVWGVCVCGVCMRAHVRLFLDRGNFVFNSKSLDNLSRNRMKGAKG